MKGRDYLIAILCVVLWGLTFPVIRALSDFVPAIFLTACRFLIIALPALFMKFPSVSMTRYFSFAIFFGCGQYLLSTLAIYYGLSAGLTAVIMQIQVFVTIGFSYALLKENVSVMQVFGVIVGFLGVASFLIFNSYFSVSMLGLIIACLASLSWAVVNVIIKTSTITNFAALVAWGAIPNIPILFGISYVSGDFGKLNMTVTQISYFLAALVFLGLIVTFIVSVFWNGLLKRHDAIHVTPFSLLIPVVGLSTSWMFFSDEGAKNLAPVTVIFIGLAIVIYSNLRESRTKNLGQ